jgi:epoxyqueuosine reductase
MQISTFDEKVGPSNVDLTGWLKARAMREGFEACGIASPKSIENAGRDFFAFIEAGLHGEMDWLAGKASRRADPLALWPEVRSIALLGMNYGPAKDPMTSVAKRTHGAISVYAQGADYHDVIKRKLKVIGRELARRSDADVKVFVDTAPVMEKPLAQAAGLGWQGKHTNLVSRDFGSWLFLGVICTTAALVPDLAEIDRCGSCRSCLDICPTRAFIAPYRIDARRCISYLTIEHKSQIPLEYRSAIGNRIYGCDDCLAVCPWNKFAQRSNEAQFAPRESADDPPLGELLKLDYASFRARFRSSPIKRIGRDRFLRNVLVAAGNSSDPSLLGDTIQLLRDRSPLVRGMAVWAIRRLAPGDLVTVLKAEYSATESDRDVLTEWEQTL